MNLHIRLSLTFFYFVLLQTRIFSQAMSELDIILTRLNKSHYSTSPCCRRSLVRFNFLKLNQNEAIRSNLFYQQHKTVFCLVKKNKINIHNKSIDYTGWSLNLLKFHLEHHRLNVYRAHIKTGFIFLTKKCLRSINPITPSS